MQDSSFAESDYSATTRDIRISVKPTVIQEQTNPSENTYAFAYQVKVENLGREKVQLMERHWIISSGGRQIGEVVGPGVVGEQPLLEPGKSFTYTSSAIIYDPVGDMYGSYTFRLDNGKYFDAAIPKFDLVFTDYLN